MIRLTTWWCLAALLLPATSLASTEDCIRTRVWDTYGEGWQVRIHTDTDIGFGRTRFYKVSLLKGRAYRILTCSHESVRNLDVLLYDKKGEALSRDADESGSPFLAFTPEKSGVYYAVLYLRDVEDRSKLVEVSWALIHADP